MNNKIFEDNRKEFALKFAIFGLIAIAALFLVLMDEIFKGAAITDIKIVPTIAISIILLMCVIETIDGLVYAVCVINDQIIMKTMVGVRKFQLEEGIIYAYRKLGKSKYFLIVIRSNEKKIGIRTKKPKEFVDILLEYNAKLVQNI